MYIHPCILHILCIYFRDALYIDGIYIECANVTVMMYIEDLLYVHMYMKCILFTYSVYIPIKHLGICHVHTLYIHQCTHFSTTMYI